MRWPRVLSVASILGLFLLSGCLGRGPRVMRAATAGDLLDSLAARRLAVTSLRARARMRTGMSGLWVREAMLVRRPDGIRIDVLSPFGLALALGVQGNVLWAYPPSAGTRYEGQATPANLLRFLGAPIAVPDVIDVLLGVPPARKPVAPPTLSTTRDGEYRLALPLAGGGETIWFAGDTLLVLRAEERRDDGVALQVVFGDYHDGFPRLIEIAAEGGRSARLTYESVETNAPVDPAAFAPPPAPRVLPLEDAPPPEAS
jgi:outer membrane lipoprotein-sorting protein